MLLWPKENPFGGKTIWCNGSSYYIILHCHIALHHEYYIYLIEGVVIDGDNPDHVSWLLEQAEQRAAQYNITGVTYRLTQGVVKRIIPAVASSNAVIAG